MFQYKVNRRLYKVTSLKIFSIKSNLTLGIAVTWFGNLSFVS